jgi:hypothetical protein
VRRGVRVRPLAPATDFAAVAALQSRVFYEPTTLLGGAFTDTLLQPLFQLDLANTLRRKLRYTALNRRAVLCARAACACVLRLCDALRGRRRFCALVALPESGDAVLGVLEARTPCTAFACCLCAAASRVLRCSARTQT